MVKTGKLGFAGLILVLLPLNGLAHESRLVPRVPAPGPSSQPMPPFQQDVLNDLADAILRSPRPDFFWECPVANHPKSNACLEVVKSAVEGAGCKWVASGQGKPDCNQSKAQVRGTVYYGDFNCYGELDSGCAFMKQDEVKNNSEFEKCVLLAKSVPLIPDYSEEKQSRRKDSNRQQQGFVRFAKQVGIHDDMVVCHERQKSRRSNDANPSQLPAGSQEKPTRPAGKGADAAN